MLLDTAELKNIINPDGLVAVKLHFGEKGNTAFIRPHFIRDIVDCIYECGGKPFLTDANTLYRGERTEAVSHITIALRHGFNATTVSAPVIIADGLKGNDAVTVGVKGKHFSEAFVASAIDQADVLVSVAHFKGHELSGFGGAIKNVGMGCASREGKMKQHTDIAPKIEANECTGCGKCITICPVQAIQSLKKTSRIDASKCIGCASCILVCPREAIKISWDEDTKKFMEKMVEYTHAVLLRKINKSFFINFLTDISPACDCYGHADYPIVPDIGILASHDPVAIDQASADMVNAQEGFAASALKKNHASGMDKFRGLYPNVNWEIQLDYAQQLGLGTRAYRLIPI